MVAGTDILDELRDRVLPLHSVTQAHGVLPNDVLSTHASAVLEPRDRADSIADEEKYERDESHHGTRADSIDIPAEGVDVEKAEADFAELSRQMSNISTKRPTNALARGNSRLSLKRRKSDIEKALSVDESEEDLPFDLERALRQSRRMETEAGIKDKKVGVLWEGLTVSGIGGTKNIVKTFPEAFVSFFNIFETTMHIFGYGKKGKQIDILRDFRGVVKPGEMVLVLGRPGSGCTTFLKVIANQRFGYTKVDGEVMYGPFDSDTFAKRYRGEAVYNMEDDVHHPTLTVGQTLGFALDTKTPGKRPGGMSTKDFKNKIIDLLLRMFNIEHTRNTVVGNPYVRGVSGGERKRVSIAEMMIAGASVCAWDNSTRGLDSSTALDYAKSLRILSNIYQTTTFVSLYQASENIYSQFDKVMVIDDGHQVFFGPIDKARAYFEGLGFLEKPRQTTPDYLTGCTDPYEREYREDAPKDAPSSPAGLVSAFKASDIATKLDREIVAYKHSLQTEIDVFDDFQTAVREGKRNTGKNSVYTVPFYMQIWALMQRQFFLKWQDKFSLYVSYFTTIVIAIVMGTVWLKLPKTSAGAFTRGGVLFISLLFNAFKAFGELPNTMLGRPLVNKHRAYTFHTPSALWLAQIVVDMLFSTVQISLFAIIVYFMCGLYLTPGAFFTFVLVIVSAYLAMTLFFRTIGCLCPDFDYAIKFVAIILTLFVISSGYLIAYPSQQVWLRWIFYVNALGLGFASMMMNEFEHLDLNCTAQSLIPYGPSYGNIDHQVCTLAGSTSGNPIVSGSSYIEKSFSYDPVDLWRNWAIILTLIISFLIANVLFGEKIRFGEGGRTVTYFAKETDELKQLNEQLQTKKQRRLRKELEKSESRINIASKAILTWENLCYDVPVPSGQLRLLRDVFGFVKPGQLTALMGASGAGKTTLLDVLAARKNIGVISGDRLVDGAAPGAAFQRGTSYAEQLDVHESTQTVREAFRFSANLRQPYDVPQAEKYAYVEEVISLLEMEDIADAIIGSPDSGLAVEQRKRCTIGVELAAKPELLLFLDEPTSGLDSQSAYNIVRFLRKLAAAGQAILCTIHQPNSALFENFDRLLLLQKGGECVYFGEVGKDAGILREYFRRHGAHCPSDANPAEWMLDAIGAGTTPRIGDQDWGEIWRNSEDFVEVKEEIVQIKTERSRKVREAVAGDEKEYATPLLHQINIVNRRTQLAFWRSPNYGFTRLFNHVALAIIIGLAYLKLDDSRASLQYRIFVIFQVTVLPALILAQVEPKYDLSRLIYYRENAAKAYKQLPFALSMVLAELPYSILCAVGFFIPIYYLPGFNSSSSRAGYQFLMVLVTELFAVTLGQMLAALTPSSFISALVNPFVVITFGLFCGVTIPAAEMPAFWRTWLYQLDPFTRLIGGMVVTELHGLPVDCNPTEFNRFTAPAGQTCAQYMGAFFRAGGPGYLAVNDTSDCAFCAYRMGDQFYEPLGLSFVHRWRDLGILTAFIGSNLFLLFLGSRYLNFNRR